MMIIFSLKNAIVTTNSDYFISNGNPVYLDSAEYVCVNFPFDALSETAIIKDGKIFKSEGICNVDYLNDLGLIVKPRRIYTEFTLLAQKKEFDLSVTVYGDFTLKITFDFMQNAKIFTLPFYSERVEIHTHYLNGSRLIAVEFCDVNKIAIYAYNNDEIFSLGVLNADTINFTDSIVVTKTHPTIMQHKTVTTYKIENNSLTKLSETSYRKNNDVFSIKEELIGVAFLEEVFLNGNHVDFLSHGLIEKAHLIHDYFGKIEKVITVNDRRTNCAVVYKTGGEYDYVVKAVKIDVTDNKITNFKILD